MPSDRGGVAPQMGGGVALTGRGSTHPPRDQAVPVWAGKTCLCLEPSLAGSYSPCHQFPLSVPAPRPPSSTHTHITARPPPGTAKLRSCFGHSRVSERTTKAQDERGAQLVTQAQLGTGTPSCKFYDGTLSRAGAGGGVGLVQPREPQVPGTHGAKETSTGQTGGGCTDWVRREGSQRERYTCPRLVTLAPEQPRVAGFQTVKESALPQGW